MKLYLDTSVLVPLFVSEVHTQAARALVVEGSEVVVSDLTAVEFASALSRLVRMSLLDREAAQAGFANLDIWIAKVASRVVVEAGDVRSSEAMLRSLDVPLTAPDVIHIAIATRVHAELATLDTRMADTARKLGARVAG